MEELILVDADGGIKGHDTKENCHLGQGKLHLAFSVLIFSTDGRLLLQRRSSQKLLWPLFWSNSVCSHPRKGEKIEEAARRRLIEELGIDCHIEYLYTFTYHARYLDIGSESETCSVFFGIHDGAVTPDSNEIDETSYVPMDCVMAEIEKSQDSFTPWFKMEWDFILKNYLNRIRTALCTAS